MKKRCGRWIMGKNAVNEVLEHAPDRIIEIYTTDRKDLGRYNVPVSVKTKREIEGIVQSESHQSIIARVHERKKVTLSNLIENSDDRSLIVMLDSIYDPQNFGAIIRSAEGFGADGVIYSKNRGGSITPVVSKASCGASEILPLVEVSNLADSVRKLQDAHYEVVVADMENATDLYTFTFPQRCVLILGSEGKGVQPLLKKTADHRVKIPMCGKISSLNVAQAGSVLMAFYLSGSRSNINR